MIVDYCNQGNLEQFIHNNHPSGLTGTLLFYFFYQILSGVKHANENGICLKALSPKNILIKDYSLKITKFSESVDTHRMKKEDDNFWKGIDMFTLGVVLYFMIYASYPFDEYRNADLSIIEIDRLIGKNEVRICSDLRLLLVKLLSNSEDRFSIKDIENCKWYNVNYQTYSKFKQHYQRQTHEFCYNYFRFEK